ncbi:hypothetical protein LTR56_003741 [Elasticomyces elasticus]|nr:hypothetical protein LTR22_014621 [Elasticomyces elasticus]KAK3654883.1 hypothetical protein LTR56_003741 [Elasticomyces elasticus]KAK4928788.1 hypothetical protein LTR49_004597 [Elasticomyces elasticus]KAK5766586.1 hypothetical protein LTS12_003205 [Elasticomyces elasticus]
MTSFNDASNATLEDREELIQTVVSALKIIPNVSEDSRKELTSAALDVAMSALQNPSTPVSKDFLGNFYCLANDDRISSEQREKAVHIAARYLLDKSRTWDTWGYSPNKLDDTLKLVLWSYSERASVEQVASFSEAATKFVGEVRQFPFLRLPPEIRNRIYELCIPSGYEHSLPSSVRCRSWHHQQTDEPAVSKTCREVRCETLPIYYNCNTFNFHALLHNFNGLLAHCERIRVWNVKKIAHISVHICEMEIANRTLTIRCGEGLWNVFELLALTDMDITLYGKGDDKFAPVAGVVSLAAECKENKTLSKDELNATFDHWLQILGLLCWCGASEYHEFGQWFSCSRSTPASQDVRVCGRMEDDEW